MSSGKQVRSGAWRSRWAAVGAAVAVALGAGGMMAVDAASSDPSSTITVEPIRILDSRTEVGLDSPPASGTSKKLPVTGSVSTQPPGAPAPVNAEVVPAGATAVILNATVVRPSTRGFLSIRPGDATATPATSNINWADPALTDPLRQRHRMDPEIGGNLLQSRAIRAVHRDLHDIVAELR